MKFSKKGFKGTLMSSGWGEQEGSYAWPGLGAGSRLKALDGAQSPLTLAGHAPEGCAWQRWTADGARVLLPLLEKASPTTHHLVSTRHQTHTGCGLGLTAKLLVLGT